MRGALAAAKARAKREKNVLQSDLQKRKGREKHSALTLKVGVMLAQDSDARRKGELLRFQLVSDPLDFVAKVIKIPVAKEKGHVVIAPLADNTDYALCANIAAALLGGFWATPKDFLRKDDAPRGISYKQAFNNAKQLYHVAASAALARELPTLPLLLRALAEAPGSCVKYYKSERELCRTFTKNLKSASTKQAQAKMQQSMCVLSKTSDKAKAEPKYQLLYDTPQRFISRFNGSPCVAFPGEQASCV